MGMIEGVNKWIWINNTSVMVARDLVTSKQSLKDEIFPALA
jgi:hypothetical protein